MALSTDRNDINDPAYRDPSRSTVNINQSRPATSASNSAGLFIVALLVLVGLVIAIYYAAGTSTAPVTQNNVIETTPATPVTPEPTPAPAVEPEQTPPALNTQPAEPAPVTPAPTTPAPANP